MSRLQKQIYDFPTEKCLEIFWEGLGWCRVTCDTFRSFKGPRRVQGDEYNGPVYYKGTNYLHLGRVKKPRVIQITELNEAIKSINVIIITTISLPQTKHEIPRLRC